MSTRSTVAGAALGELCHDLRRLREQAGGPSVRSLAAEVGLGKSQVNTILNGQIRRPPQWQVVRGLVHACYRYARERGREPHLSIKAGLDEYWRPRHALVEHAFSQPERRTELLDVVLPRQLPPAAPHFVGRSAELAELNRADGPLLITGVAGVGKTALATAWAHRVAAQFPDGQLYVDLRGFDPFRPALTQAEALRVLLESLGVPAPRIPPSIEAQVGLYRSLLSGRRMLVLLDDARDAEQVRVLLPASPAGRAVVTSRAALTELVVDGAYPVTLDVLPAKDARRLLTRRLRHNRINLGPEAVARLVEMCHRLPIALATVAAWLVTRPDVSLSSVALPNLAEVATRQWQGQG